MNHESDDQQQSTETVKNDRQPSTTEHSTTTSPPVNGILIGVLAAFNNDGEPCVTYPGNLAVLPVPARCVAPVSTEALGSDVALLFENGDINRPILMGLIQSPPTAHSTHTQAAAETETEQSLPELSAVGEGENEQSALAQSELIIDGRHIDLQAREQIVLRCGKSSITMTSAGKVIIRGTYVSSKSSGANRIKGGSVQIN